MSQPTVKVVQLDEDELSVFIGDVVGSPTTGVSILTNLSDVTLTAPGDGDHLVHNGSQWVNAAGFITGDGIANVSAGSPRTIAVDTTVARQSAVNTFIQTNTFTASVSGIALAPALFASAAPGTIFDDTGAGVDESIWRNFASSGQLVFDARNDANDTSVNWLTVDRTGTTIDAIAFTGTTMTLNGIPIHVGSPHPAGGGGGGSPLDPTVARMSIGSPTVGRPNTGQLQLESKDSAATPTIAFGSPANTGFFESADNNIEIARAGVSEFRFTDSASATGMFRSELTTGPGMVNEVASDTNPTLLPANSDVDTGIGRRSADEINIIAGAQEGLRIAESGNEILITWNMEAQQTAAGSPSGQGDMQTSSSYNQFTTVSATGVMTMPAIFNVGAWVWIKNDGDNTLTIFPGTTDNFLGLANNIPVTLVAGGTALYQSVGPGNNQTWGKLLNTAGEETGTFTATLGSAGSGSPLQPGSPQMVTGSPLPTSTVVWTKTGQHVTLTMATNINGTSKTNTLGFFGLPENLRPNGTAHVPCVELQDNGTSEIFGSARFTNSTNVQFRKTTISGDNISVSPTTWTASGTKGIGADWSVTYSLNV